MQTKKKKACKTVQYKISTGKVRITDETDVQLNEQTHHVG